MRPFVHASRDHNEAHLRTQWEVREVNVQNNRISNSSSQQTNSNIYQADSSQVLYVRKGVKGKTSSRNQINVMAQPLSKTSSQLFQRITGAILGKIHC